MKAKWKFLLGILALLGLACSDKVAGTTEETNALANDESSSSSTPVKPDTGTSQSLSSSSSAPVPASSSMMGGPSEQVYSSSSAPKSSSSNVFSFSSSDIVVPSSSAVVSDSASSVLQSRYWRPYWIKATDEYMVNMNVDTEEGDEISVSYEVSQPLGGGQSNLVSSFGIEVVVDGEGPDVFSEMKTWTGGACYMLTSDAPIVLEMGMSPEKEQELEYDLPRATLIGPNDVGNMVIRCVSWLDFEQQGTGPAISIEEAFFDYMTSLRFIVQLDDRKYKGSFEIYQIRRGGTGIDANIDGTEINVKDGE